MVAFDSSKLIQTWTHRNKKLDKSVVFNDKLTKQQTTIVFNPWNTDDYKTTLISQYIENNEKQYQIILIV